MPSGFDYGYGEIYNDFFKKVKLADGSEVYKTQRPHSKAQEFRAAKDSNTKRIFIIGGSVALLYASYGRDLENLFKLMMPEMDFEVISCAMGGYDSFRVSLIHKEILNYQPDLVIVFSGNNEYHSPIKINLALFKFNRFLRTLRIYRLLQEKVFKLHLFQKVATQEVLSPAYRLKNYQHNLRHMIRLAKKQNVPIAICTLPVNFRDAPPSDISPELDKQYLLAKIYFERKEYKVAINEFKEFLKTHPRDPFGYFFLAKSYDMLGDSAQAKEYYLKSLSLCLYPSDRMLPQRNEIIRSLCSLEDAILVDIKQLFITLSPNGLLGGKRFFKDECHWRNEYYPLINREIVQSIFNYNRNYNRSVMAPLDKWHRDSVLLKQDFLCPEIIISKEDAQDKLLYGIRRLIFRPDIISERTIYFFFAVNQISPGILYNARFSKNQVLQWFLSTPWTIKKGELAKAFNQAWPTVLTNIAETYRRLGLYPQAIEYFSEAIDLSPDLCTPYLYRSLTYHELGQQEQSNDDLMESEKRSQAHPEVQLYKELFFKN